MLAPVLAQVLDGTVICDHSRRGGGRGAAAGSKDGDGAAAIARPAPADVSLKDDGLALPPQGPTRKRPRLHNRVTPCQVPIQRGRILFYRGRYRTVLWG